MPIADGRGLGMHLIYGASVLHGQAELVLVETLLGRGLNRTIVVGMVDNVTREARDRLPSALSGQGFEFPKGKILFNLAPAEIPKGGIPQDLALALSLLCASQQIKPPAGKWLCLGELSLTGKIRPPARGTLLAAMAIGDDFRGVITAPESAREAALAPGVKAYSAPDLATAATILNNPGKATPCSSNPPPVSRSTPTLLLEDVRGQEQAREAAIIAACGHHHLLLQGPPGTGKSLLARRICHLLPDLNRTEALAVAKIEACLGRVPQLPFRPPFRAPHASSSAQGVLGGGNPLRPGELSRAHHGVLFLDEMPEFARPILEGLRQPLEDGEVRIQRAGALACFPAATLLVAARNPCPCGYATHPKIGCRCTVMASLRYLNRTSGPLLDRFDLFVEMGPVEPEVLCSRPTPPFQNEAIERIKSAGQLQTERMQKGLDGAAGFMDLDQLLASGICPAAKQCLRDAGNTLHLSGRGNLRCLRVARTISDLAGERQISKKSVLIAVSYRPPAGNATN